MKKNSVSAFNLPKWKTWTIFGYPVLHSFLMARNSPFIMTLGIPANDFHPEEGVETGVLNLAIRVSR